MLIKKTQKEKKRNKYGNQALGKETLGECFSKIQVAKLGFMSHSSIIYHVLVESDLL